MKRLHLVALLLVYLLLTALVGLLAQRYFGRPMWSETIYFVTGVVVVWYTAETHATRQVMTSAYRLNLLEAYWTTQEVSSTGRKISDMLQHGKRESYRMLLLQTFPELMALVAEKPATAPEERR